jgi:hypothetical protein
MIPQNDRSHLPNLVRLRAGAVVCARPRWLREQFVGPIMAEQRFHFPPQLPIVLAGDREKRVPLFRGASQSGCGSAFWAAAAMTTVSDDR